MKHTNTGVTAVVPFFNEEETLGACLESIAGQSRKYTTAVLVDDGSTDRSNQIAERFSRKYGWKLVIHSHSGVGPSRDIGTLHVQSEYLTYLDADDILLPGALTDAACVAAEFGSDQVLCTQHYVRWDGLTSVLDRLRWIEHSGVIGNVRGCEDSCIGHLLATSRLISTRFLEDAGVHFRQADHGEDLRFAVESWIASRIVSTNPRPFYVRRPKSRGTPSITESRGTVRAVANRLESVVSVEKMCNNIALDQTREFNRHTGLGHALQNIGMVKDLSEKTVSLGYLKQAIHQMSLTEGQESRYLGVTIAVLESLDPAAITYSRCRYWLFKNRIERGVTLQVTSLPVSSAIRSNRHRFHLSPETTIVSGRWK